MHVVVDGGIKRRVPDVGGIHSAHIRRCGNVQNALRNGQSEAQENEPIRHVDLARPEEVEADSGEKDGAREAQHRVGDLEDVASRKAVCQYRHVGEGRGRDSEMHNLGTRPRPAEGAESFLYCACFRCTGSLRPDRWETSAQSLLADMGIP